MILSVCIHDHVSYVLYTSTSGIASLPKGGGKERSPQCVLQRYSAVESTRAAKSSTCTVSSCTTVIHYHYISSLYST